MAQIAIIAAVTAIEVGVSIYQALNRPRTPVPPPALNQFSSSIAGTPVPFGYGTSRIPGTVIWSAGIVEKRVKQHAAHIFGIGFGTYYVYSYSASFAVAFSEGPAKVGRIWFDSKIVYDPDPNGTGDYPVEDFPLWDPTITYQPGNEVAYGGNVWQALAVSTGQAPPVGADYDTYWEILSDYPPYNANTVYQAGQTVSYAGQIWVAVATANAGVFPGTNHLVWQVLTKYYPQPTIYSGDEAQGPDPLIQSFEGAGRTSAERGLVYCVWENFPLANFGNRIPNVRAEIIFGDDSGPQIAGQAYVQYLEPSAPQLSVLVEAGDFLIAVSRFRPNNGPPIQPPTISDDSGGANTWTSVVTGDQKAIWYCQSPQPAKELTVTFGYTGSTFAYNADAYLIRVTGWNSFTVGANSGSGGGSTPMTVTDGSDSISSDQLSSGSESPWAGALFVFLDSMGHKLRVAPILSDDNFPQDSTNGGSVNPQGFKNLFPQAASSWSEVFFEAEPVANLAGVLTDVCERAGLTAGDIDVSLVNSTNVFPTDQVYGYVIRENRTAIEIIRALTSAYFFDAVESSGKLRFVPRGLGAVITIPESDLGTLEDMSKLIEQISQEQDQPYLMTIVYEDPTLDYQQGKQERQRSVRTVDTRNQATINAPLVLTPEMARQVAEKALYLAWLERDSFDPIDLWNPKYLVLDPADVVNFVYDQALTLTARVTEEQLGQNFSLRLKGVTEFAGNYSSSSSGGVAQSVTTGQPSRPALTGAIVLWLLDIPLVADTDADPGSTGFYWAIGTSQSDFSGATLEESNDNTNFEDLAAAGALVEFGYAATQLANPTAPFTPGSVAWDNTNNLKVYMSSGTLASASDADVISGANRLIIGNAANGYEILGYGTAVQNSDGSFTISHLLRGLRGTEWMCGFWGDFSNGTNLHAAGDLVLVADSGVQRQPEPLTILGQTFYYRAPQAGTDPSAAVSQSFVDSGEDLKPYSPIEVGAEFDSSSNCIITWQRRTRLGGDNWGNAIAGQAFPVSEDAELYDVEILNSAGTSVVRTISGLSTSTCIYLQSQQVTDFGSVQSTYKVNIYQRSAQVGRGFKGHGTVGSGITAPIVLPPSGDFYVNGS